MKAHASKVLKVSGEYFYFHTDFLPEALIILKRCLKYIYSPKLIDMSDSSWLLEDWGGPQY